MKNLAGKDCDKDIRLELSRCGIEIVEGAISRGEVSTTLTGKLGNFTFRRAWYYWVVDGPVPLAVAEELYSPEFKGDIRSGGDCGSQHPSTWAKARYEGKEVLTASQFRECEGLASTSPVFASIMKEEKFLRTYHVINDDNLKPFNSFVDTYHIDSELGLYIFVQALRKHNLV